jgi:hypothetical protein
MNIDLNKLSEEVLNRFWDVLCDVTKCGNCTCPKLKDGRKYCEIDERANTRQEKQEAITALTHGCKLFSCELCGDKESEENNDKDNILDDIENQILKDILEPANIDGYTAYVIGQMVKYILLHKFLNGTNYYLDMAINYAERLCAIEHFDENDLIKLKI